MIRLLLTDFGNVMASFDHSLIPRQLARLFGAPEIDVDMWIFGGDVPRHRQLELGEMNPPDFIDGLRHEFGGAGVPDFKIERAYASIFKRNVPVCNTLARVRARGPGACQMALASNTDPIHFARAIWPDFCDVLARCDALFLSYRLGLRKPAPAFFRAVLNALECPPGDILFVDDLEDNCDAARTSGFETLVFDPSETDLDLELRKKGVPFHDG